MGRRSNTVAKTYTQHPIAVRKTAARKRVSTVDVENSVVIQVQPNIRKTFHLKDLKRVTPLTDNQERAFQEWEAGQHLVMDGFAGTGKSFVALYLALRTVLDPETPQNRLIIVRSTVPTRDQGFLPGELSEKEAPYEAPYHALCDQLFTWKHSYNNLKELGIIEFKSTSFIRGTTFDDAVVLVDEIQNMDEQESETVITRMGRNSRIILCGDDVQNDLGKDSAFSEVLGILEKMREVSFVDYELQDIVRSGFIKSFLMAKYRDRI